MYYQEILKGIRKYRRDLHVLSRRSDNLSVDPDASEIYKAYMRGMRDAYADSAKRAHYLQDSYEVK